MGAGTGGQISAQTKLTDPMWTVKAVIRELFPDLLARSLVVCIAPGLTVLDGHGSVYEYRAIVGRASRCWPSDDPDPELETYFLFDPKDGFLQTLNVSKRTVASRLREVCALIDAHAQWSDDQVVAALTEAGARYGPTRKTDLLNRDPLRPLAPFLGGLVIRSMTFEVRDPTQFQEGLPAARLRWAIEVRAEEPGAKPRDYVVFVEPFEGTVQWIGRVKR